MAAPEDLGGKADLDLKGKAVEEQDETIYDVEPISWAYPVGYTPVNISPINEVASPSNKSKRKKQCPETPDILEMNWDIIETPRRSDNRIDKKYYHRQKGFTLRSRKAAEHYETTGEFLPKKSKTEGNEP